MSHSKNYLKTILVLAILLPLIWAHPAQAQLGFITQIGLTATMGVLTPVAYLIGYIAGQLVFLGGTLTNMALDLNSQVLQSGVVKTGWPIARDLANLGFVLAIILIAFATILRIETYQMQKLLWKLITAALLVNFSLVIAGVFIDFSGVLTNFFLSKATGDNSVSLGIGAGLVDSFGAHTILQQKTDAKDIEDKVQGLAKDFNKLTVFLASQIFVAIFTSIVAISLWSLAAMIYIRYIALTILLVLMPLAWLMWIWPELEKYWSEWWHEFLRWSFFAPAISFFLYLALSMAVGFKNNPITIPTLTDANNMGLLIEGWGAAIGKMVSLLGILYGGLYASNKMGIAGASFGFTVAGGVKSMTTGGAVWASGGIRDRARTLGYKAPDKEGRGGGGWIERGSAALTGIPLVSGIARGVNEWATAGKKEQVGAYEKDLDKLSENKDAFLNMSKNPRVTGRLLANDAYAAAYINKAADKGMLKDLKKEMPTDVFERLVASSKKMGTASKIYAKNPKLAALGEKDAAKASELIKAAMARVKPADISNLDPDDFYSEKDFSPTILLNLTKPAIKQLSMSANPKQVEAINKGIEKIKDLVAKNGLELKDDERRNFEYLQKWENESLVGQMPRTEKSKIITENLQEEFKKSKS